MENKYTRKEDGYNDLSVEEKELYDNLNEPITELVAHYDKIFKQYLNERKNDPDKIFFDICGIISGSIVVFIKSLSDHTDDEAKRLRFQKLISTMIIDMINKSSTKTMDNKEKYI